MMRKHPGDPPANVQIGDASFKMANEAVWAMSIIAKRSEIDMMLQRLVIAMIGPNVEVGAMIFQMIKQSETRYKTIKQLGEKTLSADQKRVLVYFMKEFEIIDSVRNKLAHCVWAVDENHPSDLALVEIPKIALSMRTQAGVFERGQLQVEEAVKLQEIMNEAVWLINEAELRACFGRTSAALTDLMILSQWAEAKDDVKRAEVEAVARASASLKGLFAQAGG